MKINIDMRALPPGQKIYKNTFSKHTPANFVKLFSKKIPHVAPALTLNHLLAFAIDSGYGAPCASSTDRSLFLKLSAAESIRLGDFLRTRLQLLRNLLEYDSATDHITRHSITDILENSDKADASFILGGLACRYATAEWLALQSPIHRFWHVSIYMHQAVTGMSNSVSIAGKADNKSRPDYLIQDKKGDWFASEAKGSFGGFKSLYLYEGMAQARLLKKISYLEYSFSGGPPHPTHAVIQDYACSLAYFKNKSLNIVLLDPPAGESDKEEQEEVPPLELVLEIAQLLQFHQTCRQFHYLSHKSRHTEKYIKSSFSTYRWGRISNNTMSSSSCDQTIWLGIPEILVKREREIRDVLHVLSSLVPRLSSIYHDADLINNRQARLQAIQKLRTSLFDEASEKETANFNDQHRVLGRRLLLPFHKLSDEDIPGNWLQAMQIIINTPLFKIQSDKQSIASMTRTLSEEINISAEAEQLNSVVEQTNSKDNFKLIRTLNGLLIGSGEWSQRELTKKSTGKPKL